MGAEDLDRDLIKFKMAAPSGERVPGVDHIKSPKHLRTLHERDQGKRLIVVLEHASLETIKVGHRERTLLLPNIITGLALVTFFLRLSCTCTYA